MKVLFLSLLDFHSMEERNIYTDLLREFVKHGHFVYVISPRERRSGQKTELIQEENAVILKLKIGNVQKTNLIEKGISTIALEHVLIAGMKRYFKNVRFDLVLYATPPITFQRAVDYIRKRDRAKTYLLLKDIFPQNSVDLGMLQKNGIKAPLYRYFRKKERKLYQQSDCIGCMSQANVEYLCRQNPAVDPSSVAICPNSIEVRDQRANRQERAQIREAYGLPANQTIFVYGGNLGRPQGISFMIQCLRSQLKNAEIFFLIVGDGTEFGKLEQFFEQFQPANMKLLRKMPKEAYDKLVAACDVGMIFLDHRFTIPNFPSRLLCYLQAGLPVLSCTDANTDLGRVIVDGGFGWWCESKQVCEFERLVKEAVQSDLSKMGSQGYRYLEKNFCAFQSYRTIVEQLKKQ